MANKAGISPTSFRQALRKANFTWHTEPYERWTVDIDSREHKDMQSVLKQLLSS